MASRQDICSKAIAAARALRAEPQRIVGGTGAVHRRVIDQLIDTKAADGGAAELRQLLQANPIHGAYFMAVKKGVVRIALADQAGGKVMCSTTLIVASMRGTSTTRSPSSSCATSARMSSLQDGRTLRCGLSTAATCVCAFAQSEHKCSGYVHLCYVPVRFAELPKERAACGAP